MVDRLISLSRTGRYVAVRKPSGVDVVDVLGTQPRVHVPGTAVDFACVGSMMWSLVGGDRPRIDRVALATGRAMQPSLALDAPGLAILPSRGDASHAAVIAGALPVLVHDAEVLVIEPCVAAFALGGRRVARVCDGVLRIGEPGRDTAAIDIVGTIAAVHVLYGGKLIAIHAHDGDDDRWTMARADGRRVQQVVTPRAERAAVAGDAGTALVVIDDSTTWLWLDLRRGAIRAEGTAQFGVEDLDLSSDGRHVVFACAGDEGPRVLHAPTVELLEHGRRRRAGSVEVREEDELQVEDAAATDPVAEPAVEIAPHRTVALAPACEPVDFVPRALGEPLPLLEGETSSAWTPYASPREHFDDMLDLVAARVARAIAEACDRGQLSVAGDRRIEREVRALVGDSAGLAPGEIRVAEARLALASTRVAGRVRASIAAGRRLPFVEMMRELDLSPLASHILMFAIAAVERVEIARLLRLLDGETSGPLVDRGIVELVLAGSDRAARAAISAELAAGASLRRHGVLHITGEAALASIEVDPVVVERCCGWIAAPAPARTFAELWLAATARSALVDAVIDPRPDGDPLRLVLRGRRGSGRRSAVASLAAMIGRTIADIDVTRLPRSGSAMAAALHDELRRAVLRGCIPVVSALEIADRADSEGRDRIRQVVRAHPGPIAFRTALESELPIDPGVQTVVLTPQSESMRAAFWRDALARAGVTAPDPDGLASRWRLSPGQIEGVIAQVKARPNASVDDVARQHIATRLAHVATPVRRLAEWEHVALTDDMIDSLREFIGRVAQRKTVFDDWGFDAKLTSARGLTALFYGPPGTGKSMVAGVIARELGLELYRVDLSRVVSKWIGETEKNLGEVFDAAEDGQVAILFDEADSLFAKRTEVKTSNDRYANLEVNYLLQRLDSFEGVAILTTNLDGSIDPAFKRRMSMRLHFPFPDEEIRQRLWAAHIPPATPTANDFNFRELARRFQLSGGYIRNCTLRAAFIAAQERRPLSHEHLLRAIALEFRELGKIATDGRIE